MNIIKNLTAEILEKDRYKNRKDRRKGGKKKKSKEYTFFLKR